MSRRHSQYWRSFNISRAESEPSHAKYEFQNYFFRKHKFLVRSLTIPFESPKLLELLNLSPPVQGYEKLLSLPNELLLEIIGHLEDDIWELACFAITCRRALHLSHSLLEVVKSVEAAPWHGCRIACIGDRARVDDLPDAVMNAAQRAKLKKAIEAGEINDAYAGVESQMTEETSELFRGACALPQEAQTYRQKMAKGDQALYDAVLSLAYPQGEEWALFNVNKMVYVRAAALAQLAGRPSDPQPFLPNCRVDLGHALLARISWSSVFNRTRFKINRGPWAGDRFYICTMKALPPWYKSCGIDSEEWKDVSEEVVNDLKTIHTDWGIEDELEGPVDSGQSYFYSSLTQKMHIE